MTSPLSTTPIVTPTAAELTERHATFLGLRTSALIEMALFFIIMLVINMFFGSPRFFDATPHPFWIIVVLTSAQYGSNEGLVAVFLATLVLLVGNLPAQAIGQDSYDWILSIALRPILWLVAAVILGEITRRHLRARASLVDALHDSHKREETFSNSYEVVRARKERLELHVAGQVRTETSAYHAAKAMEKRNPDDVLSGIATMIESALGAQKFSIFTLDGDTLQRRISHGWDEQDANNYDESYRPQSALYQSIIGRKEALSVINEEHERSLAGHGIIAGPMIDTESGTVVGMIKIEDIPFLELNLHTIQSFQALCEWSAMALNNARYYQQAVSDTTVNPEHNLMTRSFFNRYRDYITALARRIQFNVFMVAINVSNYDVLTAEERIKVARILSDTVHATLRTVDFAFDHQHNAGNYAIILPATDGPGARIVRERLERSLKESATLKLRHARFAFSVEALHEVSDA